MKIMKKRRVPSHPEDGWKRLFGAALVEHDPRLFGVRLRDAKNAIMDRIEDSMRTASQSERRLLLTALNTLVELERVASHERPGKERSHEQHVLRAIDSAA